MELNETTERRNPDVKNRKQKKNNGTKATRKKRNRNNGDMRKNAVCVIEMIMCRQWNCLQFRTNAQSHANPFRMSKANEYIPNCVHV